MSELEAIVAVYSYYLPEIRRLIDGVVNPFPHHVFLQSVKPGLDDFHVPIIDKYIEFHGESVSALKDFPWKYPTAGSSEGIFHYISMLAAQGTKQIYVLEGEYEGYSEYAKALGMETVEVDLEETDPRKLESGMWFISNPSARDGNIIPNAVIDNICDAGHKVFYDLAYLGMTRPNTFNLGHENIVAAVVSLSKPYGLFYYRVGFTFSRQEIPSLYANKWFKGILPLMIAERITEGLGPNDVFNTYRPVQEQIIAGINKETGLGMLQSDAFLLGFIPKEAVPNLTEQQLQLVERFRRRDGYRFCLTPYYEQLEKQQ